MVGRRHARPKMARAWLRAAPAAPKKRAFDPTRRPAFTPLSSDWAADKEREQTNGSHPHARHSGNHVHGRLVVLLENRRGFWETPVSYTRTAQTEVIPENEWPY